MSNKLNTPPQLNNNTQIYSLYVLKCVAAFIVVACHTRLGAARQFFDAFYWAAVPIFYLISGYFLYSDNPQKVTTRIQKTIPKILRLVIILQAFYFLYFLPDSFYTLSTWDGWLNLLLRGDNLWGPLWYLTAYVEALVLLWLLFRCKLEKVMYFLPILFLGGIMGGRYAGVLGLEYSPWVPLFVWDPALPALASGYLIHRYEEKLTAFKYWLPLLCITIALGVIEQRTALYLGSTSKTFLWTTNEYAGNYIITVLVSIVALITCLKYKQFGEKSWMATIGLSYSALIYYFHRLPASLLTYIEDDLHIQLYYGRFGTIYVFILSVILAWLLVKIQERLGWKVF